jgi:hypothetical protein
VVFFSSFGAGMEFFLDADGEFGKDGTGPAFDSSPSSFRINCSTEIAGHAIYRLQRQMRRPISQFLEIRSTSDSDGEGSLSIIAPLAFGCDSEGTE